MCMHLRMREAGKPAYVSHPPEPTIDVLPQIDHTMTKPHSTPRPDALITEAEAAALLAIAPATLKAWRSTNRTAKPVHCRIGGAVRYRRSDIDAFIAASVQQEGK